MSTTTDPWGELHAKFAPMLLAEARLIAQLDPDYEPVCLILGADAAMEPEFQRLLHSGGGEGFRPGNTLSWTMPREMLEGVFAAMGRTPDDALPRERNGCTRKRSLPSHPKSKAGTSARARKPRLRTTVRLAAEKTCSSGIPTMTDTGSSSRALGSSAKA